MTIRPLESEEITNAERASMAATVLECFAEVNETEDEPRITLIDLLANIMHYCKRSGVDFHFALEMAQEHYEAEISDGA